jgi:hypothetical protein
MRNTELYLEALQGNAAKVKYIYKIHNENVIYIAVCQDTQFIVTSASLG